MLIGAAIGLLASLLVPMGQRAWAHRQERAQSIAHHRADLSADRARHVEKLRHAMAAYKASHTLSLTQHADAMRVALGVARRETVRDVWGQRSALNQTIMFNGALMLSCAFENFSQSELPRAPGAPMPIWLLYALNASLGAAVLACASCIVLCLKLQDRLGWYALANPKVIYHCGKAHETLNDYFSCHCESIRWAADALFYAGCVSVVCASVFLQAVKFYSSHHDKAASIISLHAGFSLAGAAALPFLMWRFAVRPPNDAPLDFGGLAGVTEDETRMAATQRQKRERERNVDRAARQSLRRRAAAASAALGLRHEEEGGVHGDGGDSSGEGEAEGRGAGGGGGGGEGVSDDDLADSISALNSSR